MDQTLPDEPCCFRLFDLVMALSTASDMISPAVANHGKRVAYIACALAAEAGLSMEEQHELVLAGVLHDIGALALKERLDLLQFEVADAGIHTELGYQFLSRSRLLNGLAPLVRFHHQDWDGGAGMVARGQPVPLGSHVLRLADRIDAVVHRLPHPLGQVDEIVALIAARRDKMFMPRLADAFARLAVKEYFWLDIVSPAPDSILGKLMLGAAVDVDLDAMLDIAILFSHIVDFKSTFTSTHSAGVANSAEALARLAGFTPLECRMMLIAGYLHDLGKLAVPSEILDKPSGLDKDELGIIRTHTYYTRRILEAIPGLATITDWAASHHERLNGEGYPYHAPGDALSPGARMIAVADVFTALTETRPYRAGLPADEVRALLTQLAAAGRLDASLVELLFDRYDEVNACRLSAQEMAAADYWDTLQAAGL